ncbi:PREDICTED: uncharacterized protein LOC104816994 [Tarenaya hassleriana]|uniref:uncharacterized protein LOC104816994 n=1 Tax=Tarenaya hassleriana TaxID=28532 RepID=UPI00053C9E97|nr:PREDICTED: uncharacterized protein LOC104816994 [Tarenaya hassleriana]
MVQMMSSRPKVKLEEIFDSCHSTPAPLPKRAKFLNLDSLECDVEGGEDMGVLAEPSPLGLRLKKSPSFLDFIKMRLSQQNSSKRKKEAADKLKASNFPASLVKIGTWEYKSRYEGDLVGKCYFAKHKLVWEMLDGGLKNKIEIQWSDIVAIKATYSDDGPDALDVVLARQPLFFRETNPQPRKHTLWKATSDFTGGQASLNRRHLLQCPRGLLGRHFEKLVQCDPRLHFLSQQPEIFVESPYFEPRSSINDDDDDDGTHGSATIPGLEIGIPSMAPATQTPSATEEIDFLNENPEDVRSVIDTRATRKDGYGMTTGMRPSASISDLLSRIGHCISQEMASGNLMFSPDNLQGRDIMGEFAHCLLNDTTPQLASSATDEQIMSRVNSLCCLLQMDGCSSSEARYGENPQDKQQLGIAAISRNESLSDLLLTLPRIASLPQFLPTISEGS